jgi:hypothetical protein
MACSHASAPGGLHPLLARCPDGAKCTHVPTFEHGSALCMHGHLASTDAPYSTEWMAEEEPEWSVGDNQSKAIEAQVLCMRCKRGWGGEGAVTRKGGQRLSVAMQEVSCKRVTCVQGHAEACSPRCTALCFCRCLDLFDVGTTSNHDAIRRGACCVRRRERSGCYGADGQKAYD